MFLPSWRGLMLRLGLGWALTSRAIPHLEEGSPLVKSHCAQTSLSVSLWGKYLHTPPKFFFSSVCFSILKSVRKLRKPLWKRQLGDGRQPAQGWEWALISSPWGCDKVSSHLQPRIYCLWEPTEGVGFFTWYFLLGKKTPHDHKNGMLMIFRGVLEECWVILLQFCLYNTIKPRTGMQISEFSVGSGYLVFMLLLKFNLFKHKTTLV